MTPEEYKELFIDGVLPIARLLDDEEVMEMKRIMDEYEAEREIIEWTNRNMDYSKIIIMI